MIQKHKTIIQCNYCNENVSSIFYNKAETGTMQKLKGYGLCKTCFRIYKIHTEEIKFVDGGLRNVE